MSTLWFTGVMTERSTQGSAQGVIRVIPGDLDPLYPESSEQAASSGAWLASWECGDATVAVLTERELLAVQAGGCPCCGQAVPGL